MLSLNIQQLIIFEFLKMIIFFIIMIITFLSILLLQKKDKKI